MTYYIISQQTIANLLNTLPTEDSTKLAVFIQGRMKMEFENPTAIREVVRLNDAIAHTAYILDCLRNLRNIYEAGDCNNCKVESICKVKPMPGQMVRYNCPFYEKGGERHG